ncbi:MAG: Imm39 family immunity protein [bacterium]
MDKKRPSYVLGAVGTVQGRFGRWYTPAQQAAAAEIREAIDAAHWLAGQPFTWIHHIVLYAEQDQEGIKIKRLSKWGDLPVSSVRSMTSLRSVFLKEDDIRKYLRAEAVRVLKQVQEKKGLPPLAILETE